MSCLDKLRNLMSMKKDINKILICNECRALTNHIEIGFLEYERLMGRPRWCGNDTSWVLQAGLERAIGIRLYKCEECGSVHKRNSKNEVLEEKLYK